MINDRGRMKWVSLMIPQHKKLIADMYLAENYQKQPILDEQKIHEINEILFEALNENKTVLMEIFINKRTKNLKGIISKVDTLTQTLKINSAEGNINVSFSQIIDISLTSSAQIYDYIE